ncbi:hypothetical protein HK097_008488 [Rhizophlyctis rosea]|uniref:Uncharacterized protein n=1 Tax=Rhizophlyctis rosea TaxID=64517 RepID=A0AAD5SJ21_9FUNG|nr:hypothetical protein HK097_008488 [Rhizophlyctis rosea]
MTDHSQQTGTPGSPVDAENSIIDNYQIPDRISEPTTLAAVANVEPVHGDTLVSTNATPEYGVPERILQATTIAAVANVEPVHGDTLVSTNATPEYGVPERIFEPSTIAAVAAVEPVHGESLASTRGVMVEDVDVNMPGALPDDSDRFYESDEEEPHILDAVKSAAHGAQETLGNLLGNASNLISSTVRRASTSRAVPPVDVATAGSTTGSVVGTVAGTVHAATDIARAVATNAAHTVADTVRPYLPQQAAAPATATVNPLDTDIIVTATARTVPGSDEVVAVDAHVVQTPLPPPVTASPPAQPTLVEKAQTAAGTARDLAASAYQTVAEKAGVATAVASDLTATATEKASGVAATTSQQGAVIAEKTRETATTAYDAAAYEALNAKAAAQVSANQSYEQSAQRTAAALEAAKEKAAVAVNAVEGAVGVAVVKASEVAESVKHTAEAAAHKAAEVAHSVAVPVVNTATAAKDIVVGAKDTVVGATTSAYQAAANTATTAKDTVVGTTSSAYQSAANTAGTVKERALGSAMEAPVAAEEAKPGVIATAQQKLADTAAAVSNAAANAKTGVASTVANATSAVTNTVSGATAAVSNTASNVASTVASAPSTAYNYVRGGPATNEAVTEQPSPVIPATGAIAPEYVQGVSGIGPEEQQEYSREEIADAEEAERARRNKPGESARQAFEHARQEASAFASGLREHLGEAGNIPALSVPRRELIREAEEAERAERGDATQFQRSLAEDQARAFTEGLKDAAGVDHLRSAVDVARTAQIHSAEESEREARVQSLEPAAALAVAAAVREGLNAGDSAAVGVARREVTRDAEEQAREEKINTEAGERSIAHNLATAFQEGVANANSSAAGVARLERIRDAEEQERADRIQEGWKAEALAHEQARLVASGLESVDLKHVTGAEQAKATREAEEAERERRIKEVTEEGHQAQVAPAVAAAVVEGLKQSHATGGVSNPAISIANRELGKDEEEKERQERIHSGDSLRNAGSPTKTAFAVRSGLLHEDNPATAVARKTADSEGVQEALPSVAGRGITPAHSNALPSPTKTAYDVVRSEAGQSPTSHNIPITDFGRNSPTKQFLGQESLLAPRPPTPERAESIAATQGSASSDENEAPKEAPKEAPVAKKDQDVGLRTIRPSPSEVVRESDILDDVAPATTSKQQDLTAPSESQATERSISPESRLSSSSLDSEGNKKPKKLHGLLNKAVGKIEVGFGKVTRNTGLIEKGQEMHAAGAAEIAQARERAAK